MTIEYDAISTRDAFGVGLLELARANDRVFAVAADTEKSMGFLPMRKEFPDRVFNVGICEQNMALVAAGIAACGGTAFAATYAPFASMRMLEQVRTFIAYPDLDVKIISGLAGLSGNIEGVTHQGLEDVSIMRAIPNMAVIVPADAASTTAVTRVVGARKGPVYLRLGREAVPKVFDRYEFVFGKANVMKPDGADAAILTNGVAVSRVLAATELLRAKGYGVRVVEIPCVKPLDDEAVLAAARETGCIVTVEENNVVGGLGGAVSELLADKLPTRVVRVGLDDSYAESGTHNDLLDLCNLSVDNIGRRVEEAIKAKR